MIDIQPHLHKLEVLKEYMALKIDCGGDGITFDLLGFPIIEIMQPSDFYRIYKETGNFYYRSQAVNPTITFSTFDEYYNDKINIV